MQLSRLRAEDGQDVPLCQWLPATTARGVVLVSHGMSEYAARYDRFALALNAAGYAVYAHDHRGHGAQAAQEGRLGWFAEEEGWDRVVADLHTVRCHAEAAHPGLPLVVLGHSMGSFIVRAYFLRHGEGLAGLVLSSTGYRQRWLAAILRKLAAWDGRRRGWQQASPFMAKLVFGSFNLAFMPTRTRMDWLSRDSTEVDAYIADPLCGGDPAPGLWHDLFGGIIAMEAGEAAGQGLPKDCPVYLLAGSRDPVSQGKLALGQLARRYRAAGLRDVETRVYPGGRHEMLNESNRDQVMADLLGWLKRVA